MAVAAGDDGDRRACRVQVCGAGTVPRVGANRRRRRSVRMSVASLLLVVAAVVVAWTVGTGWMVGPAAVLALLSGLAATRITTTEVISARRDAARERAEQARAYRQLVARSTTEHARNVSSMSARLTESEHVIDRLRRALRVALRHVDESNERALDETHRVAGLEQQVAQLRLALGDPADEDIDELAYWDGSQAPTVVDLLSWDQRARAAAAARPGEVWRRHA